MTLLALERRVSRFFRYAREHQGGLYEPRHSLGGLSCLPPRGAGPAANAPAAARERDRHPWRAVEYDQRRTVRIQVLLEDYTDSYGRVERRLAAYELDGAGEPAQRLSYLATLRRPEGKKRIEGELAPLREYSDR